MRAPSSTRRRARKARAGTSRSSPPKGGSPADPRAPMRLPIDQLSASGFLAPEQGRIVLERVCRARRRRRGERARRDVRHRRRHAGAPRGQDRGDVGRALQDAVAELAGAADPQSGPRSGSRAATCTAALSRSCAGTRKSSGGWTPVTDGDRFTPGARRLQPRVRRSCDGWPALEVPRGLLRIEGTGVELSVPEATMAAADGRKLALKGTFSVDLGQADAAARTSGAQGPGAACRLPWTCLQQEAPGMLQERRRRAGGQRRQGRRQPHHQRAARAAAAAPRRRRGRAGCASATQRYPRRSATARCPGHQCRRRHIAAAHSRPKASSCVGNVPATLTWQHVYGAPAGEAASAAHCRRPVRGRARRARPRHQRPRARRGRRRDHRHAGCQGRAPRPPAGRPGERGADCSKAWAGASRSAAGRCSSSTSSRAPAIPSSCATSGWTARTSRSPAGWAWARTCACASTAFRSSRSTW